MEESTRAYSITGYRKGPPEGESGGYGYLWWVNSYGASAKNFSAAGSVAKYLVVFPERDLVVVYLCHTEWPDDAPLTPQEELKKLPDVSRIQLGKFLNFLLEAQHGTQEEKGRSWRVIPDSTDQPEFLAWASQVIYCPRCNPDFLGKRIPDRSS